MPAINSVATLSRPFLMVVLAGGVLLAMVHSLLDCGLTTALRCFSRWYAPAVAACF
jgi:hypothetical protein